MHFLDPLGSILSVISTIFYVRASQLAWPIGLLATCVNGSLYFITGLYADMSLEGIYFISMFYGWYQWRYGGKKKTEKKIGNLSLAHGFILLIIGLVTFTLVAYLLGHYTPSKVPYWDAGTTVISLIAQWLTCRKIIETWIVWFVVDGMYVYLYFHKGIPFHALHSLLYLGMAVAGYAYWQRLRARSP